MNQQLTSKELEATLNVLHDRGVVNEIEVGHVLRELVDGEPLTLDRLVAMFGVEPIYQLLRG